MYFNEVLLGNNCLLAITDVTKIAIITHLTFNYMMSRDVAFTENMYAHFQNQMKRSTLISEVSERKEVVFSVSFGKELKKERKL